MQEFSLSVSHDAITKATDVSTKNISVDEKYSFTIMYHIGLKDNNSTQRCHELPPLYWILYVHILQSRRNFDDYSCRLFLFHCKQHRHQADLVKMKHACVNFHLLLFKAVLFYVYDSLVHHIQFSVLSVRNGGNVLKSLVDSITSLRLCIPSKFGSFEPTRRA